MEFLDSAWFQIMSMMRDENTEDWSIWASNAAMQMVQYQCKASFVTGKQRNYCLSPTGAGTISNPLGQKDRPHQAPLPAFEQGELSGRGFAHVGIWPNNDFPCNIGLIGK